MAQDRVGIIFPKKRKVLINIYGEYLGTELHKIITKRAVFDKQRLGINPKGVYTFRITYGDNDKCWLMVA